MFVAQRFQKRALVIGLLMATSSGSAVSVAIATQEAVASTTLMSAKCSTIQGFFTRSGNELQVRHIKTRSVACANAQAVLRSLTEGQNLAFRMGPYTRFGAPIWINGFKCQKKKSGVQMAFVSCRKGAMRITATAEAAHSGDPNPFHRP